ncbi:hypothetical protein ANAEL_03945 [Anaerolineales bacterium]|nr:hypothetical protein ANAEL_03945 [Anaerolineales bacterium]
MCFRKVDHQGDKEFIAWGNDMLQRAFLCGDYLADGCLFSMVSIDEKIALFAPDVPLDNIGRGEGA